MTSVKLPGSSAVIVARFLWAIPMTLTVFAATEPITHFNTSEITDINLVLGAALMTAIGFSSWLVKKYIRTTEDYIKNLSKMNANLEKLVNELEKRPCARQ